MMQSDDHRQDADPQKREPQDEIPLLEDVVLPYVDLDKEDAARLSTLIDSGLAGIEEGEDDLALERLAEEDLALAGIDDSYDYGDEEEEAHQPPASGGFSVPQHNKVVKAIRDSLHQQLSKEMTGLITPVVEQAIEQTTQQISRLIHDELTNSMEERISLLIQQELDRQFGKE